MDITIQNKDISVAWLPASVDACAMYRMFIPYCNVPNSLYLFTMGPLGTELFANQKVAVVQRQVSEHNRMAMLRIKEKGLKLVYDLDDNIWALPSYNPGKNLFNTYQDGFRRCAELADILTVSTMGLATAARTGFKLFDKEIIVVPNSLDFNLFKKKDIKAYDEKIIIGWGGSNTHSQDVSEAFESVVHMLDKYPNVHMEIVGAAATDTIVEEKMGPDGRKVRRRVTTASNISKHPQTDFRPWVPVGEYPNRLTSWGWDIALAPLQENRFNKSKSNIKMLEAAALQIPCLASDVQPYYEFCSLGGSELKWLLCPLHSDWERKLTILINEPERRAYLGKLMYDTAFKFFNIDTIKENWLYVFRKVLSC